VSQQITLQVAGIGYDGNRAGTQGQTFKAQLTGPTADKVHYRIEQSLLGNLGVLMGITDRVGEAYIRPEDRSVLRDLGVYTAEREVRDAGMSNYVLWLLPEDGTR
jgi:hypothetical protein